MAVTITHTTPADGTFSATGAAAWDANHAVSGLGTMAEQDANNVNITGGSITGVTGVLTGLTVNSTPTSGGAAGQIMFDTGSVLQESSNFVWDNTNGSLTVSSIANPTIPSLTINGASNFTGATLSGVQITGTAGQFSCNATTLTVGEFVTISGTFGGTGSITGYANPTTYRISATNGTTTFTLVNATTGAALTTTAGTPTGLTYTVTDPFINLSQTWNNSVVAFQGIRYNVTDTASNASSSLLNLQVGGVSKFNITKAGLVLSGAASTTVSFSNSIAPTTGIGYRSGVLVIYQTGTDVIELSNGWRLGSGYTYQWTSNPTADAASDTFIGRRGAANLRFGAADAAAPIAQTLSVQSVVAGTTNTAGANLTITGSQSTGTGAAGNIIFQTSSAAASTGTAQNALATVATIGPNTLTGSQATSLLDLAQTWNTSGTPSAIKLNVTDTASNASSLLMDLQVGGTTAFYFTKGGLLGFGPYSSGTAVLAKSSIGTNIIACATFNGASLASMYANFLGSFVANGGSTIGFASGDSRLTSADTILTRRGAANLRFGAADAAAPVAQTLSVQSVVAGTSNTAGANLTITGSQGTGTGAGGDIIFQTALAGSSGTAQNALITALRIYSNQTVAVGKAYTVATLPAAGTQGRRAWVTDATVPTFLGALTGGGAVVCPVFDNGTAWVAG